MTLTNQKLYRAFAPVFLSYMERRGGWPDDKPTCEWLKANGFPYKRDYLSALRLGRYAPEKYAYGFLETLIRAAEDKRFSQARRAVLDFLKERNIHELRMESLDAIISHVCTTVLTEIPDLPQDEQPGIDSIVRGLQVLVTHPPEFYLRHTIVGRSAQANIPDAVRWIYVRLAQCALANGPSLPEPQAIAETERLLAIPFADYVQRAASWAAFNPWIVLFAKKGTRPLGTTILLPVNPQVYEDVRTGKRRSSEVEFDDLNVPSNYFIFEGLAENPDVLRAGRINPTRPMLMCMAAQHGALMRLGHPDLSRKYHFLAPEATPSNRDRMLATGYKATGIRSPVTSYELWERIIDFDSGEGVTPFDEFVIARLARICPSAPPIM